MGATGGSQSGEDEGLEVVLNKDLSPLIPRFLENRKRDLEILSEIVERKDLPALFHPCHALKGNFLSYGFKHLGNLATRLETETKRADLDQASKTLSELRDTLERTRIRYIDG